MSYPGGKGGCYRQIISRMPQHSVYIEPFLGAGSVLKHKKPAAWSIGVDADPNVVSTWRDGINKRVIQPLCSNAISGDAVPVDILQADALDYLRSYAWQGDELIYCDPPYLMSTRSSQRAYYDHEFATEDEHRSLLNLLLDISSQFDTKIMISGYASGFYADVLRSWHFETFSSSTRRGSAIEYLWMNFIPVDLSEYGHIGGNYRERERIKRQQQRWSTRFEALPEVERDAMLRVLLASVSHECAARALVDVFGDTS